MYDHYFSNFGSSPVPEDICKDSAIRQSPMIPAKVQPQGILGSGGEDF